MKSTNSQGDYAECVLMCKALELGLRVSKPISDDSRYDIITDRESVLNRIQIKSTKSVETMRKQSNRYAIVVSNDYKKERYTKGDIDTLALYIIPEDDWYIIPIEKVTFKKFSVTIGVKSRWDKYKNKFELL